MHVILLGTKVADYIKNHIGNRVDNAEFQVFRSFEEFLNITSMRHVECDRLVITSEVFMNQAEDVAVKNLRTLKELIDSQYQDTFTVTLSKVFDEVKLCESVFYGDSSFNICLADKVKPGVLKDLLILDRDSLVSNYKNYMYDAMAAERNVGSGNDVDAMFTQAQNIVQSTGGSTNVSREEKKNGGIFGNFGGRKKGGTPEVDTSAFAQDFNTSGNGSMPSAQPTNPATPRRKPAGFGRGNSAPQQSSGFDTPQNAGMGFDNPQGGMSFDAPNANNFNSAPQAGSMSFDVPNANNFNSAPQAGGFDTPQGGMGFDTPQSNMGGFDNPNNISFDVPNQGFSMPQRPQQSSSLESATPLMMPNMSADMFNTAAADASRRESSKLVPRDRGSSLTQANTSNPTNPNVDFNALAMQYREETAPVKIVTKEVVREVVKEVPGGGGGATKYQNIINGNTKGLFLVTGDRRTGVTHTAITMANFFSQKVSTLYVDLDTIRHGSLFFLGLEDVVDSETAVQNGLNLVKTGQDIKRYAFRTTKFKFESLISMPGTKYSDSELKESLSRLVFQSNNYDVIIIDCPMENIRLAEELLYSMDIFICVDSDLCGCNNILTLLDDAGGFLDKKLQMVMRGKSKYIVKQTEDRNEFANNMEYLEQTFALAEEEINWARLPFAGTLNDIENICMAL